MRPALRFHPSALGLMLMLTSAAAFAQTYNADGSPSMIPPNGDVFGTGGVPANPAPSDPQAQYGAPTQNGVQERFDIDCDPDIEQCVDPNADSAYDDGYDPEAYQQFQSALSPYGQWSDDPDYGQVWTPAADEVGNDFEPYDTAGQWVASSDYGFSWVSDYGWGWAPFHYGRWLYLNGIGWSWVPGRIWGPAWVDWRNGNGYCGWAPMPPRGIVTPAPTHNRGAPSPWHFTLAADLTRRNPVLVPAQVASSIYARTQPVGNTKTVSQNGVTSRIPLGPSVAALSRELGHPVPAMALKNSAPSVLPRSAIVARAGVPLAQRSYVQHASTMGGAVGARGDSVRAVQGRAGTSSSVGPGVAPRSAAPRTYTGYSSQPVYRAPVPSYSNSTYTAPRNSYSYSAPSSNNEYRAPAAPVRTAEPYRAPAAEYRAPSPEYRAPVEYRAAPAPAMAAPRAAVAAPVFHSAGVHRR